MFEKMIENIENRESKNGYSFNDSHSICSLLFQELCEAIRAHYYFCLYEFEGTLRESEEGERLLLKIRNYSERLNNSCHSFLRCLMRFDKIMVPYLHLGINRLWPFNDNPTITTI